MNLLIRNSSLFILILLCFIVLIEGISHFLHIPKISHHNIYAKTQNLIPQIDTNTVLILGDSRIEWGIKPIIVKKQLKDNKRKVINLSMPNSNGLDILNYLLKNEIYPKAILIGFTPYYGKNTNHNLDKQEYSFTNKLKQNFKYFTDQLFYIKDESIQMYFRKESLYFKNHNYDEWGGVNVYEYGNYSLRLEKQIDYYSELQKTFSLNEINIYCKKINLLISLFKKGGTKIYGIYMPVSNVIHEHEISIEKSGIESIKYDTLYNFSNYIYTNQPKQNDSIYFYDGSHLSHEFSYFFSGTVGKVINDQIMNQ